MFFIGLWEILSFSTYNVGYVITWWEKDPNFDPFCQVFSKSDATILCSFVRATKWAIEQLAPLGIKKDMNRQSFDRIAEISQLVRL